MTFYEISILMHYAVTSVDPEPEHLDMRAPAWRPTIESFVANGVLRGCLKHRASWEITERGRAYLDALCAVPLPVNKWVMPVGFEALETGEVWR